MTVSFLWLKKHAVEAESLIRSHALVTPGLDQCLDAYRMAQIKARPKQKQGEQQVRW